MRNTITADLAIWGRIPPPIGGMAMHLRRLLPHLLDAGITVQMYSLGRPTPEHPKVRQVSENQLSWFIRLLFGECEPVHYVFSSKARARFMASLLALLRGAKVVLRIGGGSLWDSANSQSRLERLMIRFAVQHATAVVGVNQEICGLAKELGAKRVIHAPGFIPEIPEDKTLPSELAAFIEAGTGPLLLAAGEIREPAEDDLYGAYMLLDAIERLPSMRLVFYAYQITRGKGPQEQLGDEIRRRRLQDRYLLFSSATDLLPAMLRCDLMVRPVLSDGDSISVREALYLGLPTVASDCVKRPEGVATFPTGDLAGLQEVLALVLNDLDGVRQSLRALPRHDHAAQIVGLFNELLGREKQSSERAEDAKRATKVAKPAQSDAWGQ